MIGSFGMVILGGGLATVYVKDIVLQQVIVGALYFAFIAILFLTELLTRVAAGDWNHIRGKVRDHMTGAAYTRHFYFLPPEPIGDTEEFPLDPMGIFNYGYRLRSVKPVRIPRFGKQSEFRGLCRRPWSEMFNFVHTGEAVAEWNGIAVPHRGSDDCEIDLFILPQYTELQPIPILIFDRTGVDALERARALKNVADILHEIPEPQAALPAPVKRDQTALLPATTPPPAPTQQTPQGEKK